MGNGIHYVKTTSILPDEKDLPQNTSPPYHRLVTAQANNYALKASCWTSPETSPRRSEIAPLIIMSFLNTEGFTNNKYADIFSKNTQTTWIFSIVIQPSRT